MWTVWTAEILLLVSPAAVIGVSISCGDNGIKEVLADQDTVFTCTAEGQVEWRYRYNWSINSILLATCKQTCEETNDFHKLFMVSILKADHSSSMTIKAANHSNISRLLNGSLQCVLTDGTAAVASDHCELEFVYPPEDVYCTAVNTSWYVNVSCIIGKFYSSRGIYTCQLYRLKHGSKNESVERATAFTSPTSEYIVKNEVKKSGSCQFNTTLTPQEGQYAFYISVSPGGRKYIANLTSKYNWITIERPSSPSVFCGSQSYVLENTNITCTCNTTNLGQPKGYLRWIVGNQTNLQTVASQGQQMFILNEIHHTQFLTQTDHGRTWFRCDLFWGAETFPGENYTAKVGYAAKPAQFVLNGNKQNLTVSEGEQVKFLCESDGRPTPNVSIYNNDNDTLIRRDSSVNYTFVARCEDSAVYTCSAWNEFSLHMTTSLSFDFHVKCKPRRYSSTRLEFYMMYPQAEMNFDIIAYPVPHEYRVWLVKSPINNRNRTLDNVQGPVINITCQAGTVRRYLSTCTLRAVNIPSQSTASYKVQIINEAGDDNITVTIDFNVPKDLETHYPAVTGGGVCIVVFIFTVLAIIVIIKKRKESKAPLKIHIFEAEIALEASQPEPCQTPLYAVVDKTKKANRRPAHNADTREQTEKESKQSIEGSEPELPPACQVVYAIVDKTRNKSPGRRQEVYLKCNGDHMGEYQNVVSPHPAQDEDSDKWDARSPASRSHTVDDGRWLNSAGLLYTFPTFDYNSDMRCRPPPTHEETEYCTLRLMGNTFPALDRKSND